MAGIERKSNPLKRAEIKERKTCTPGEIPLIGVIMIFTPLIQRIAHFGFTVSALFWAQSGSRIFTYTIGSAYVALGLGRGEAIGAIFLGALVSSIEVVFTARPGTDYGIGYTVANRLFFGMRGSYFVIFAIFISGMVSSGIQAYYGGQAVSLMLSAIFPSFKFMEKILPGSAAITTQDLIGLIIYAIIYVPVVYWIKPPVLRLAVYLSFTSTMSTYTAMLIWALVTNGGTGFSTVLAASMQLTASQKAFRFI